MVSALKLNEYCIAQPIEQRTERSLELALVAHEHLRFELSIHKHGPVLDNDISEIVNFTLTSLEHEWHCLSHSRDLSMAFTSY